MGEPPRVLAPDCSAASEAACRWMVANFTKPGDEVHLVTVLPRSEASIIAPGEARRHARGVPRLRGGGERGGAVHHG